MRRNRQRTGAWLAAGCERQKTPCCVSGCIGVGLHSGARIGRTLRPGMPGPDLRFRRVDLSCARRASAAGRSDRLPPATHARRIVAGMPPTHTAPARPALPGRLGWGDAMTRRAPNAKALFVDRQIYEHRPGGGRFVTFTRKAQLRLLTLFLAFVALGVLSTTGLVLGYRLYREQGLELARLQAAFPKAAPRPEADGVLEQARGEIDLERRALADARAALEVEKRSLAAALEAAEARAQLLAEQLDSAERGRRRLGEELQALRRQAAASGIEGAAMVPLESERDRLLAENQRLVARGRELEIELQGRAAEVARLGERLAEAERRLAGTSDAAAKLGQPGVQLASTAAPGQDAAASLAELKSLGERLQAVERRNAELEAFVLARAPAPPARAPR
jgi:hypothetical protein